MTSTSDDLVKVFQAANAAEAHVVHGMLDDAGVASRVVDEQEPFVGVSALGTAAVMVHARDEAQAVALIEEYESSRQTDQSDDEPDSEEADNEEDEDYSE